MKHKIVTLDSLVEPSGYGGKAHWLSWLHKEGYNVPYAVFLPAMNTETLNNFVNDQLRISHLRDLLRTMVVNKRYDVAVRSSATLEDCHLRSFAGHFRTFLGAMTFEELVENVKQVVDSLKYAQTRAVCLMGVVIQKRIKPRFSGVAFSSNPVTCNKNQCIVTCISGKGELLVSGRKGGEDITLTEKEDRIEVPPHRTHIDETYLKEIWRIAKAIENKLEYPVDIEWCVEERSKALYLLQCRPVTGMLPSREKLFQVCMKNKDKIPSYVLENEKVALRLTAEQCGIKVSNAWLIILACSKDSPRIPDLSKIRPSDECRGYSVVLIYPKTLSGKVKRFFVDKSVYPTSFPRHCQRYSIRSYPKYGTLHDCVSNVAQICCKENWVSVQIVQEIFDPKYSGVVKKISDGYLIELAQGHFVPKGVVPTSQYVLTSKGNLVYSREVYQEKSFRIIEGHVLEEVIDPQYSFVSVPTETLSRIIKDFLPFLKSEHQSVEFGILESLNKLGPYLIDFVLDRRGAGLDRCSVSDGVVSKGVITGRTVSLMLEEEGNKLDFHFYDKVELQGDESEPLIFLCKRPDISLLKVVQAHNPKKMGFIFEEGSMLCHLAIILREKGIPAIIAKGFYGLKTGEIITVDSATPRLAKEERISHHG
jgi:phosphohistidine swiveling domain-containing protein